MKPILFRVLLIVSLLVTCNVSAENTIETFHARSRKAYEELEMIYNNKYLIFMQRIDLGIFGDYTRFYQYNFETGKQKLLGAKPNIYKLIGWADDNVLVYKYKYGYVLNYYDTDYLLLSTDSVKTVTSFREELLQFNRKGDIHSAFFIDEHIYIQIESDYTSNTYDILKYNNDELEILGTGVDTTFVQYDTFMDYTDYSRIPVQNGQIDELTLCVNESTFNIPWPDELLSFPAPDGWRRGHDAIVIDNDFIYSNSEGIFAYHLTDQATRKLWTFEPETSEKTKYFVMENNTIYFFDSNNQLMALNVIDGISTRYNIENQGKWDGFMVFDNKLLYRNQIDQGEGWASTVGGLKMIDISEYMIE